MMRENDGKRLLSVFSKYCGNCWEFNYPCCNECADTTVFDWELKEMMKECKDKNINLVLKNRWGNNGKSRNIKVERISQKEKCPFLGSNGCILKAEIRPLDCISYPIYPMVRYYKNEKKKITSMFVHKSCPFAKEIAKDKKLMSLLRNFWEIELTKIKNRDLKYWFGDKRNYWLDKNIIKIETK